MRSYFAILLIVSSVLLAVGALFVRSQVAAQQAEEGNEVVVPAVPVRVVRVERLAIPRRVRLRGFLEAFERLTVSAEVAGEIVEQWVEGSDDVRVGQPLFKIDEDLYSIQHERAQAAQQQADSEFKLAEANWQRIEDLPETSSNQLERIEGQTNYLAAQAKQREATAVVREAALNLEKTTVKSPIAGVVARVFARRGEFMAPGRPMAELIEIDRLKMLAEIEDRDVLWVTPGQVVMLTSKILPGEVFCGHVHRVFPQAMPTSRKYRIEIALPNSERRLKPGFFMKGEIVEGALESESCRGVADQHAGGEQKAGVTASRREGEEGGGTDAASAQDPGAKTEPGSTPTVPIESALVVPREAVIEVYGQSMCYVATALAGEDGLMEAVRVPVEVLPLPADIRRLHVVSGLSEGDLIVVKGMQHLSERSMVRLEK